MSTNGRSVRGIWFLDGIWNALIFDVMDFRGGWKCKGVVCSVCLGDGYSLIFRDDWN
jgi:hypothetical protein